MKKFRSLTLFVFGIIATAMLGACSCSKTSTINVHMVTATIDYSQEQVVEKTDSQGKTYAEVVVGTEFTVNYEIKPAESSNTKVMFDTSDRDIVRVSGPNTASGATGSGRFIAVSPTYENEYGTVTVTTDDGGYTASIRIKVMPIPTEVSIVTDLKYNSETNRVEWAAVDGAVGYLVKINGENYRSVDNYYTGTGQGQLPFEAGESYRISVLAKGDTVRSKDALSYSDEIIVNILVIRYIALLITTEQDCLVLGITEETRHGKAEIGELKITHIHTPERICNQLKLRNI